MSQPPGPNYGQPSYGGYGGDLQHYGRDAPPANPQPYVGPPLPPPNAYPSQYPQFYTQAPARSEPPQRPAVITFAAVCAVTASAQWIVGLAFVWLVAAVGLDDFNTSDPTEGGLFHIANRFHLRMLGGLAWPLFLFPAAAIISGFLLIGRFVWARIVFTALGAAALGWSIWWLHTDLRWLIPAAAYIIFACSITWTPMVTRWYAWGPRSRG